MLPKSTRLRSYLLLLTTTLVWSVAFIVVKPSLEITTPTRYLLYRYAIASVLSIPFIIYFLRRIKFSLSQLATVILLEFLGVSLALSLVYTALRYTTALEANILTSSLPLFVTLGGVALLKEREEEHEWVGLVLALLGTILLVVMPALGNDLGTFSLKGNLLILGHNIANMIYYPLAKKYYKGLPKLFVASISFFVGLFSFLPLALIEQQGSWTALRQAMTIDLQAPSVWLAAGYMAIFGSIIGLTAYIKGQEGIEVSEATLFSYLQPLIYIPVSFFVLGEGITFWQLIGLATVMIGVYIAERRPKKRRAPSKVALAHVSRRRR